jgi:hypothetical protein
MTSELNLGVSNALSTISIESLADMGYGVAADQSRMGEDIWWGPIGVVDAAGSLVRIHRSQRRP